MHKQHSQKKTTTAISGFTLAEVLVTLAVIGVVASLTIPNLMQSYQNTVLASQAKQGYSMIAQATKMIAVDGNGDLTGNCFAGDDEQALACYAQHLSVIKECSADTSSYEGCFYNDGSDKPYKWLNGNDHTNFDESGTYAKARLKNGMSIAIQEFPGDCAYSIVYGSGPLLYACGEIMIDVNGDKGPNKIGRDVFWMMPTKTGEVIPYGSSLVNGISATLCGDDYNTSCNPDTTTSGNGCLGRILKEGKMNY